MTTIPVSCPSCGRTGRVAEDAIGRVVVCPACNARHRLEARAEPAIQPPATAPNSFAGFPDPANPKPLRLIPARRNPPKPTPPVPVRAPAPKPVSDPIEVYTGPYELDDDEEVVPIIDNAMLSPAKPSSPPRPPNQSPSQSLLLPSQFARFLPDSLRNRGFLALAVLTCLLAIWAVVRSWTSAGFIDPISAEARENAEDPIVSRSTRSGNGRTTTTITRQSGKVETRIEDVGPNGR